jgi:hypothetical protein
VVDPGLGRLVPAGELGGLENELEVRELPRVGDVNEPIGLILKELKNLAIV